MRRIDLIGAQPKDKRKNRDKVSLLVAYGTQENWGGLDPLRETSWGGGVQVISGEVLSHALHGFIEPLLKALRIDPHSCARKVLPKEGECSMRGECPRWNPQLCRPGGKFQKELGPPECYFPPIVAPSGSTQANLFTEVALSWREGRHTIVVTEEGAFNFK